MSKTIRLTETKLKEMVNDALAQSYGGTGHSYPSGGQQQWASMEEENRFHGETYTLDLTLVGDSDMEEVKYIISDLENRLNVIIST